MRSIFWLSAWLSVFNCISGRNQFHEFLWSSCNRQLGQEWSCWHSTAYLKRLPDANMAILLRFQFRNSYQSVGGQTLMSSRGRASSIRAGWWLLVIIVTAAAPVLHYLLLLLLDDWYIISWGASSGNTNTALCASIGSLVVDHRERRAGRAINRLIRRDIKTCQYQKTVGGRWP